MKSLKSTTDDTLHAPEIAGSATAVNASATKPAADTQPSALNGQSASGNGRRKFGKMALYTSITLALGMIVIVGGSIICAPDMTKYEQRSQTLYDSQGNIIYTSLSEGDYLRIKTEAKSVEPLYIKMLLASEDERFYYHPGVDPIAAARALISNVSSLKRVSGASTLAMQVCRMLEPKERTLWAKIREALGALYLTHVYGREQILDMYLTLAPFGGNIEGVSAASYSYFNHGPEHLTPAEAALLVAIPRSPESMRPDRKPKVAKYYRNEVLKKAVDDGLIRPDILATATNEAIPGLRYKINQSAYYLGQSIFKGTLRTPDILAATLAGADYASSSPTAATTAKPSLDNATASNTQSKAEAHISTTLNKFMLDPRSDGLDVALPREIISSIDPEIQQALLDAVANYAHTYVNASEQDNIAILAVDNETFEVKGYVGGVSADMYFVDAVQSIRSPGSALKPFVYGMAFEQGLLHPNTILLDAERMYRTYQPRNYDRVFFGEITAAMALQSSLNLPALDIMTAIGPVNFISRLNSLPNALPHERATIYPPLTLNENSIYISHYQHDDLAKDGSTPTKTAPQSQNTEQVSMANDTNLSAEEEDALRREIMLNRKLHERAQYAYPEGRLILPDNAKPDISMALGGTGITLYDLTQLFAALANDGIIKPLSLTSAPKASATDANYAASRASPSKLGAKLMEADAARATYKILEGASVPLGFYNENMKISYKTGTSFKNRDAWAVGSYNNITIGVWVGRNNSRPTPGYTGYSNAAPVLFTIFNNISTKTRTSAAQLNSVLLRPTPPIALRSIEIKDIGRVQKRNNSANNTTNQKHLANQASSEHKLGANAEASSILAGARVGGAFGANDLKLIFPIDESRLNVGFSKRIMIQFTGGQGPYYILINDVVHDNIEYFEPDRDGLYTITVIDSNGKSASAEVFIQGVSKE